jgi:pyridoxine/pyridoxamine 5'-phosphate oxidase
MNILRRVLAIHNLVHGLQFDGVDVPRPPMWGGWVIEPIAFEFWQGRPSRLHDRFRYSRATIYSTAWSIERLAP